MRYLSPILTSQLRVHSGGSCLLVALAFISSSKGDLPNYPGDLGLRLEDHWDKGTPDIFRTGS